MDSVIISGNDKDSDSTGATVGGAVYSMSLGREADSLYDALEVRGRPSCIEDGQGGGTRRIRGSGATEALKKVVGCCWYGTLAGVLIRTPQTRNFCHQRSQDMSEKQAELSF